MATLDRATEEVQLDSPFRIVVKDNLKSSWHRDLDPKLLAQLPAQAGLQRLAGLTLAPREFPEASEVSLSSPASDQITTLLEDQCGRNLNDRARP